MKITVIGGGSTYTPELIQGFLARLEQLPVHELCLMDIDPQRLEIVGGFARRIVQAKGSPFAVTLQTDQQRAIEGAAYVLTQLRVGMMAARRADEYLGLRHDLIGQETVGVGGMAKALRTIPVILSIANDLRRLAPGALLLNFTNPAGLVTQALAEYAPDVSAVGVCNAPYHAKMNFLALFNQASRQAVAPERAALDTLGLNHLSWHRDFLIDGESVWSQIMTAYLAELQQAAEPQFDPQWVEALGMVPNYYLEYYVYTGRKLAQQQAWPPSRAEQVMQVEADLLRQYADPALVEPPADLMKRGGAYYSTVATQLIAAHTNDLGEVHVANVRQAGAVPGWPERWVLEMPSRVDRLGIHPLPAKPLPEPVFQLLQRVKTFELLTAQAAVTGDRQVALRALIENPLGPDHAAAAQVLDDLLETNRAYLPNFFPPSAGQP
jgi:6-phospho-beta-glucosidase